MDIVRQSSDKLIKFPIVWYQCHHRVWIWYCTRFNESIHWTRNDLEYNVVAEKKCEITWNYQWQIFVVIYNREELTIIFENNQISKRNQFLIISIFSSKNKLVVKADLHSQPFSLQKTQFWTSLDWIKFRFCLLYQLDFIRQSEQNFYKNLEQWIWKSKRLWV